MTKTTNIVALIVGFALTGAAAARAQGVQGSTQSEHPIFVSINAGGQIQTRQFSTSSTFPLYNETAQVRTNQTVNGGFVFDASAGYRVWKRLSLGVGVSTMNVSGDAALTASVPNAVAPNRPTVFTATASGLHQNDVAVNIQAVWDLPVTSDINLAIVLGPSFIHVSQEFATVTPTSGTTVTIEQQSASTAKAGNAGLDLSFKLTDRMGIGGFFRYLGGEVDLPLISKLKVGGLQAGGGLRLRF